MDDRVTDIKERLANNKGGLNVDLLLTVIFVVDFIVVTAIVASLSPSQTLWIAPLMLGLPFAIFAGMTFFLWKPYERRFPAAPQSRDAIVKLGQSLQLGRLARFNNAISLAADEDHLHLIPFAVMRLAGAKVISIPWSSVTDLGPARGKYSMRLTKAKVDGLTLAAPEWAMSFARVELPDGLSTAPSPSP